MTKSEVCDMIIKDLNHLTVTGAENAGILYGSVRNLKILKDALKKEEDDRAKEKGDDDAK